MEQTIEPSPNSESILQRTILDRLTTIRVGKSKIVKMLRSLKEKDDNGENIDREMIERLLSSYDGLKKQEEEYIDNLLGGLETNDTQSDLDSVEKTVVAKMNEGNLIAKSSLEKLLKSSKKDLSEEDLNEMVKLIDETNHVAVEAYLASQMNDQIKSKIQLIYEEKKMMEELHKKELQEKTLEAKLCLEKAKAASLKLANESSSHERKQRQLERLRREAAKRGYIPAENDTLNKNSGGETDEQTKSGKNQNDQKKDELIVKFGELDLRIPPFPSLPISATNSGSTDSLNSESSSTNKNDDFRAKISSRFASIEARKQQMRQLRSKINTLGQQQKMDNTYNNALTRLQNLEEMRKKLEDQLNQSSSSVLQNENVAHEGLLTKDTNEMKNDEDEESSTRPITTSYKQEDSVEPVDIGDTVNDNHASVSTD